MKTLAIIKYVFTLVGVGLLAGAINLHLDTSRFLKESRKTQAEVIDYSTHKSDGSTMYAPVIRYTANDGRTYEYVSSVSSSSRSYNIGEKVEIFYVESNPQNPKINSFMQLYFGEVILFILGGVFFLIGGGMMWADIRHTKQRNNLLSRGVVIHAKFKEVGFNSSLTVNGRSPYVILCQWLDPTTNQVYVFESDNIWFNPEEFVTADTIPVYIESGNPKKYWVDISFLPKLA